MRAAGAAGSAASKRRACSSTARIAVASSMANPLPMQTRGPAPKGRKAYRCRPAAASGMKRSGSKRSGSVHSAVCRCTAAIGTTRVAPAGTSVPPSAKASRTLRAIIGTGG